MSRRALWTAKVLGDVQRKKIATLQVGPKIQFQGWILGIDPSLRGTGLAVIEFGAKGAMRLHHSQTVSLKPQASFVQCLGTIALTVQALLNRFPIQVVAAEQTIYVQNARTAHILGAARGAALAAVGMKDLEVHEYLPLRIKQAVVGFGRASKEQVAKTVSSMLRCPELALDEADAAAVAICHAFTNGGLNSV